MFTVAATPKDETLKDEGSKSQKLVKRRDEPQPEKLIVRKTKDEDEGARKKISVRKTKDERRIPQKS